MLMQLDFYFCACKYIIIPFSRTVYGFDDFLWCDVSFTSVYVTHDLRFLRLSAILCDCEREVPGAITI